MCDTGGGKKEIEKNIKIFQYVPSNCEYRHLYIEKYKQSISK